jgi:hypothetical protein
MEATMMIKYTGTIVALATLVSLTAISATASASGGDNVHFDKRIDVGGQQLEMRGNGVLRYMRVIKVYAGALYTLPGISPDGILADTPKRLEVEYFLGLSGEDFGPATYKGLANNISAEEIERLRTRIDYHNSLYEDVQPGDRYTLTYIPGVGTELALNGVPRGVIQGADFAAAIFSLWLGDQPIDERFKRSLLGKNG